MRKITASLALLFLFSAPVFSQSASIKGTITDTSERKNLLNSVIALIDRKDSILIKFTRSDKDGKFQLINLPSGRFILMATHPSYADYIDTLSITADAQINLGAIPITPKSKILEEVIVRQNRAVRMKGDTIEYTADSFKVQDGANVKELLKKLPGMQVDRNGQVTAQGQKVEKVLVDGEEFFSDDPAVVIENLRADYVDKVQSFDKKSDQAEFTGVDDGSRSKTLNLVLKEDKKKGYFGKLSAGGGTDKRYSNEGMLNFFKGKKKASVYGIMSNTGRIGLDWQDRDKYGGGGDWGDADIEAGTGYIMISNDNYDDEFDGGWNPNYDGEGIPRSIKAGAHFSDKWHKDFNQVNGNYSIKQVKNDAEGNSLTKYILPDSAYYFRENHRNISTQTQQLLDGYYDVKFDSLSSIRFRVNGTTGSSRNELSTNSGSDDEEIRAVNRNTRNNINNVDNRAFKAGFLYKQKFKTARRTLSWSASHKYSDRESNGFLFSETDYYDRNGLVYDRDSIDQMKQSFTKTNATLTKLVYTEPVGKKSVMEFNYSLNRTVSGSDRKSFDKVNGKYENLNPALSIDYALEYLSNSAGAKYQYSGKKLTANIGTNVGFANYVQKDSAGKEVNHFRYTNLFPNARINYRFGPQRGLNLSYNGSSQPPTIDQIQPIFENTDPLNVIVGNPDLKQAFQHRISTFFNDYKVLSGRSIWLNASYNFTENGIVTSQVTDTAGKRTQQYVNTKGNYNFYWYGSYGIKMKKAEIYANVNTNVNLGRYVSYVNGLENSNRNTQLGGGLDFYKDKQDKYTASLNANLNRNFSKSTISNLKNAFWSQNYGARLNVYIKKRWDIGSDVNFDVREKIDAFDKNNNVISWNASITYKTFKNKNGLIKISANDILDQRKGFDRFLTSNYVQEKNYQVLRRYFMLTLTWNFTKNPGTTNGNGASK